MLMDLPAVNNAPTPSHHTGGLTLAMILGGAIGAVRAKEGHTGEGALKGAAVGAIVVFSLVALLGATAVGGVAYMESKWGHKATQDALNQALRDAQAGRR